MKRLALLLIMTLGMAFSAFATFNPTEYANLTYTTVSGQTLDLYEPTPLGALGPNRPAIVFIHGGGWVAGEKEDMDGLAWYYATLGYATISINYRLTGVAPWPACIDDCQGAVRWLRKYAGTLHVDAKHVAAYGFSAGGHLVNCLVTNDMIDNFDPALSGYSSRVQAGVCYLGPSDLTDPGVWSFDIWQDIVALVGHRWTPKSPYFKAASPAYMVSSTASPLIIFGSESDNVVPIAQSREMHKAYLNFGLPVEYYEFPGAGHGLTSDEYAECFLYEQAFLKTWIGG